MTGVMACVLAGQHSMQKGRLWHTEPSRKKFWCHVRNNETHPYEFISHGTG